MEAIISQETWDAVHNRMLRRTAPSARKTRPQQNPLSGMVYCSQCHRVMQRRPYQTGRTAMLICTTPHCSTVSSDLPMVEQRILDALDNWLLSGTLPDPDQLPDHSGRIDLLRMPSPAARKSFMTLICSCKNNMIFWKNGIYDEETFLKDLL